MYTHSADCIIYSCKVQKQAKLIYSDRRNTSGRDMGTGEKEIGENALGVMKRFCI